MLQALELFGERGDASLLQLWPKEAEKLGGDGVWLGAMNPKELPDGGAWGMHRSSGGSLAGAEVGRQDLNRLLSSPLPGGSGSSALG